MNKLDDDISTINEDLSGINKTLKAVLRKLDSPGKTITYIIMCLLLCGLIYLIYYMYTSKWLRFY